MSKLHVVGTILLAMLAVGTFVATEAFAAEWLHNGTTITTPQAVDSEGTEIFVDLTAGYESECNWESRGTVGPGNNGVVTAIEILGGGGKVISCKLLKAGSLGCEEPSKIEALNLEWDTELKSLTSDLFGPHPGGANPGFKAECKVFGVFKVAAECSGPFTVIISNEANGTVDQEFRVEGLSCNNGDVADIFGLQLILLTDGHSLSVS